jgi:hypothetical protein
MPPISVYDEAFWFPTNCHEMVLLSLFDVEKEQAPGLGRLRVVGGTRIRLGLDWERLAKRAKATGVAVQCGAVRCGAM